MDKAGIKHDPRNARKHNPRNLAQIESSIQRDGFGRSILLAADGTVIAGNATIDAAASAGFDDVLVVETDGTKVIAVKRTDVAPGSEQFTRLALADNRAAELASWDAEVLAGLNEEMDLSAFFQDDELNRLLASVTTEGKTEPDAVPEVKEARTKPGDLWVLGDKHRILCGDSTVATDVERLMGGATPRLMITDPPYGVDYDPAWRQEAADAGHLAYAARRVGEVKNDTRIDWSEAWSLVPCDVVYCWHADRHASEVQRSLELCEFEVRCQIIWSKSNFPISRGHYHWRHEPCWYAVRKGKQAHWIGDRTQTTVWEINLDKNVEGGHSTQKPVECMARPMRNHDGDVYDPFLGSGTTLIAAEQLNRTCYGLEIDPHYCSVILQRWANFTGGDPVRDDGVKWSDLHATA